MKLSRDWLSDYVDLSDLSDDELAVRFTSIGHAVEAVERHAGDTVFDLEITTNRVDAMSHHGMARELAAALGRELRGTPVTPAGASDHGEVPIRIEAPEMCARFSAIVIRGVTIRPSSPAVQRRLEAVGLRPINNVVDATNYVMLALGHPLHAYDLAKIAGPAIIVRQGHAGERIRSLDGQMRSIDPTMVVIADAARGIGLGGIIGGEESEIGPTTRDVLLECAWFEPAAIRRTARRLGIKTDASYRFERGADPGDSLTVVATAAAMIVESAGGVAAEPVDVRAREIAPVQLVLRRSTLHAASGGAVGEGYALELLRRLQFDAHPVADGIRVVVPSWRGDIHEEMDLVEEVLRFFGFDNVPAELPRLTTGDVRTNVFAEAEDAVRTTLVGCGLTEAVTYSFIAADANAAFSGETQISLTNSLSENIAAMRLSLLPGLLETVAYNRSYGTRDGALFEVGRTYHRIDGGVREIRRCAIVMYGSIGSFWGDAKRPVDFFDVKGAVEAVAAGFHVPLTFAESDESWLRTGRRAAGRAGDRRIASVGFVAHEILQRYGIKGEVAAAEIDIEALLQSVVDWKMKPVARFPGVPMILAMTHGRDLPYERIVEDIRRFDVPYLHEIGLRDRFVADNDPATIKTTLGMWYQAFDRSLTQEEVAEIHGKVASRLAATLPVKVLA